MTKKAKRPKKRNPQDATRRNVHAASKRDAELAAVIELLKADIAMLEETLQGHVAWVTRTFEANAIVPAEGLPAERGIIWGNRQP
jgi:hypothetical protein